MTSIKAKIAVSTAKDDGGWDVVVHVADEDTVGEFEFEVTHAEYQRLLRRGCVLELKPAPVVSK